MIVVSENQEDIIQRIIAERHYQDGRWGVQEHEDTKWGMILGEEVGEACEAVLKLRFHKDIGQATTPALDRQHVEALERELVQVAAVAIAWLEAIRKRKAPF